MTAQQIQHGKRIINNADNRCILKLLGLLGLLELGLCDRW
jgi:hypothetical protein